MTVTPTLARTIAVSRSRRPVASDVYFGDGEDRAAIEGEFFGSLWLPNGTSKTSCDRRLDDVNALVEPLLARGRPIAAMDVAVGSGISSLEWLDQLRAAGYEPRLVAGDLSAWACLTTYGRRCALLSMEDGTPIMLEMFGRAVNLRSSRRLVRSLSQWLERRLRLRARRHPTTSLEPPRSWRRVERRIPLVSPRLLARGEPEVISDDLGVGGRFSHAFDVVRAANILNRAYFDRSTLTLLVSNLVDRVNDGGLLVVCRTTSGCTNDATVFRRAHGEMTVVSRLGRGSEVEDLVLLTNGVSAH